MVNLVTVKDRELIKTGKYQLSTGEFEATPELIKAAIEAHEAGILRKPVVRLGHNDPRFSGDPAVGWVDNVRASEDGSTLYGDLVGVPEWLADVMPSAYPSVSIEGLYDYTDAKGDTHDFVLTGLALLGVTPPGIDSLQSVQDVARLYDIAAAGVIGGTAIEFTIQAADAPKPYGNVTYADSKNGKYPIDTAEHVRAAWSYINMPKNQKGYSPTELASIKGRIKTAAKKFGIDIQAASAAEQEGAVVALPEKLAEALGVDASADEDSVLAAIAKLKEPPEAAPAPQPEQVAAAAEQLGLVMVNKDQYEATVAAAAAGAQARDQQIREANEGLVMAAIREGKIPPARKDHWLDALKADQEGTTQVLASLKPILPVTEIGHSKVSPNGAEPSTGDDSDSVVKNYAEGRIYAALGLSPTKKGNN